MRSHVVTISFAQEMLSTCASKGDCNAILSAGIPCHCPSAIIPHAGIQRGQFYTSCYGALVTHADAHTLITTTMDLLQGDGLSSKRYRSQISCGLSCLILEEKARCRTFKGKEIKRQEERKDKEARKAAFRMIYGHRRKVWGVEQQSSAEVICVLWSGGSQLDSGFRERV